MLGNLGRVFASMLVVVVGLEFATEVISAAVAAGTTTGAGSFIALDVLNRIVPTLYYLLLFGIAFGIGGGFEITGRAVKAYRGTRR